MDSERHRAHEKAGALGRDSKLGHSSVCTKPFGDGRTGDVGGLAGTMGSRQGLSMMELVLRIS